jgi:hypothetical protein
LVLGFEPAPAPRNRYELLDRIEHSSRGSEVCHGATFVVVSFVALFCISTERLSEALWVAGFNLALNGYPVMLQRANRWRVQQVRASPRHQTLEGERLLPVE